VCIHKKKYFCREEIKKSIMHKDDLTKLFPLIELLARLCDKDRVIVLEYLNCDGCTAMYECILNGLHNKALSKQERKTIQKVVQQQEEEFRYLKKTKSSPIKKHKQLVKVGASTGVILKALLPLLSSHLNSNNN
jgi:hypothetical protein